MNKKLSLLTAALWLSAAACLSADDWMATAWNNNHVLEINRLPARGGFMPYALEPGDRSLSLNGTWRFH